MPDLNRFVQHAIDICNDNRRGYDQPRRMSGVDIDCSELVRESLAYGGFSVPGWLWTGNEIKELTKRGWVWHEGTAGVRYGDILWKKGHTAVHIGHDTRAEAWMNEFGGASGGKQGDQTGNEVRLHSPALDDDFTGYLRWEKENEDMISQDDITKIAKACTVEWAQYSWNGTAEDGNNYNALMTLAHNVKTLVDAFKKAPNGFSGVGDLVASHPYGSGTPESERALWDRVRELNARQQDIETQVTTQGELLRAIASKLGVA